MKKKYIFSYIWQDIWYKGNRPFTLINIIAIGIATAVFVILIGSFLGFQNNTNAMMDSLGLSVEITSKEEQNIDALLREQLAQISLISSLHWWTPTSLLFYDCDGMLRAGLAGRTISLNDPLLLSLHDIRTQEQVHFLSKQEQNTWYDEIGIIVPMLLLKQLSYLPATADANKPETWQNEKFPTHLKVRLSTFDVSLPIIGVVAETDSGNYLLSSDCYNILALSWHDEWKSLLFDRNGTPIFSKNAVNTSNQNPILSSMVHTHATAYTLDRKNIIPILHEVRGLGLRASSGLEDYIEDYEQQETFFLVASGGICFIMFFFSGVILFSTFQALVLRKLKEIGILKACGASKYLIYRIFSSEAIMISTISSMLGLTLGMLFGFKINDWIHQFWQAGEEQWFIIPWSFIVLVFVVGIIFSLCVTFLPIRMAVRVDPDVVIRS